MNTQNNSALHDLLARFDDYVDLTDLNDNAEEFARALIAECCTDLVIVPRSANKEIERAMLGSRAKDDDVQLAMLYDLLEFRGDNKSRIVVRAAYAAAIAATQPAAQEK